MITTKMINKSLNLIIASIFVFVFLMSAVSALSVNPSTLTFKDNSSKTMDIFSNESSISFTPSSFQIGSMTFTIEGNTTIDPLLNKTTLTITPQGDILDFDFDKESSNTFEIGDGSDTQTVTVKVLNENVCRFENPGDLSVSVKDVDVIFGYGDDDEFFPLDKIEVEVEIENKGDEDIDDIELEWGIYDSDNKEWIIELDEVEDFDLREGDEEVIIISFTLDKKTLDIDLEELEDGFYNLYVRATGEVDNEDNDMTCSSDSERVEIVIERDFVIVSDLKIPESIQCNTPLQISGDIWNVGDRSQDDVRLRIENFELGINEFVDIGDIDEFDSKPFNIVLELSEEINAGTYFIHFDVLDEDGDLFEADHDDQKPSYSQSILVTSDCKSAEVAVSATLQDGGQAGKDLTVKAVLTNTGSKTSTYLLNAASYSEWANSAQFNQNSITIEPGESKEVLVTLNVKKDSQGEKLFNLEIISDNELIANQPVSVEITKRSIGITGFSINNDNWHLWGIGFLNLILVIVIVFIAIRIARR